ncbi:amino acid adenylation [Candidatus Enterovibrio escicola]|uniref:amino acid adenylation n=1 Tax=Candidatus Enterovibrio escicola TaxID=1927127 RepID=UPI0012381879|nr:amino acid adenylation [Candidatus Enterovibrio escacola]
MNLLFSASNALNKWLGADLPRLPSEVDRQAGVNALFSDANQLCWQVHIIDNRYQSLEKTIVVCEANSRFTFFLPVMQKLSLSELTDILQMEWQSVLAETLNYYQLLPSSDIAMLLSKLSDVNFDIAWMKNTDLSINGHITDAGLWVTETLRERGLLSLTTELALDIAIHLNTQRKRIKKRKEKFIPIERLLDYCTNITTDDRQDTTFATENIIRLNDFRAK